MRPAPALPMTAAPRNASRPVRRGPWSPPSSSRARRALVALALAILATWLGAAAVATASHQVQVMCVTYGPHPTGAYRVRPHRCVFHKPGAPVDYADTVDTRHLHWLHWGQRSATATGKSAENMVGLVPVRVKLTRPVTACGHTVFSRARFAFPRVGGGFGRPLPLDTRFNGC